MIQSLVKNAVQHNLSEMCSNKHDTNYHNSYFFNTRMNHEPRSAILYTFCKNSALLNISTAENVITDLE